MCIYVQKSEKPLRFSLKSIKKSSTFTENPCAKMQKTQKSEKTIMFYMKSCKNDALLVKNLQRECFFNPRNPRGTLFRTGSLLGSKTPLYYLVYENPISRDVGK